LLQRLLSTSEIGRVRELNLIPAPNYVLQFDQRYKKIWDAYLRLIREQRVVDNAWRWRHRTWSEICLITLLAALRQEPSTGGQRFRGDLLLHREQVTGRFIDLRTPFPTCTMEQGLEVDVLYGHEQRAIYEQLEGLADAPGPDIVLVARSAASGEVHRVLGIWTLLDFGLETPVGDHLPSVDCDHLHGLLVTPRRTELTLPKAWSHVVLSPVRPQDDGPNVRQMIRAAVMGENL